MNRILLSEKFKTAPWLLTIEPYLRKQDQPIKSDPQAREPRLVPLVIIDYGNLMARFKQMRYIGKLLFKSVKEMAISASSIRKNPYAGKRKIDPETLKGLEEYATGLGISEIGYTKVNPRYIFKNFRILFENALVFTIEMDKEKIKKAPSVPTFVEIFRTYYDIGVVVNKVADYLRDRGYNAHAGPAIGGDVNYIPVAIDAGLGMSGKNGLLITRKNGPRVRLAAIFTDIDNLPFSQKNPHAWIRNYCQSCNICVQKCPANAIYSETKTHHDLGPVFIDHTKCALPFSNDNGCTLCVKYCPFSYVDYEKLKTKAVQPLTLT
jgi:Pyruvate/2-oxoacid:ferredoxin oxidoreductase delta subunit